jgi:hypothetical protein
MPKGVTEKILAQKDKLEGERKQVTVMFCDMEGFTGLSDKLGLGRITGRIGIEKATQAEKTTLDGIEILKELQIKPRYAEGYIVLGELLAEVGRIPEAREKLAKAADMFQEMGMRYWGTKTREALDRL